MCAASRIAGKGCIGRSQREPRYRAKGYRCVACQRSIYFALIGVFGIDYAGVALRTRVDVGVTAGRRSVSKVAVVVVGTGQLI